jgi:hypothetical protein
VKCTRARFKIHFLFIKSFFIIILATISITHLQCFGFDLECAFSDVPYGWGQFVNPSNEFKCVVIDFIVRARDQIITSVNQDNTYFNLTVTKIYINSQVVHFLPERIEKFFPNINEVQIINSSLTEIDKFDLKAFKDLEFLNLPHNKLEVLKNDLFVFTPKLRYVYINNNNLKFIDERLFDVIRATNFLASFEFNPCIHFFFHNREGTNNFQEFKTEVKSRCREDEIEIFLGNKRF